VVGVRRVCGKGIWALGGSSWRVCRLVWAGRLLWSGVVYQLGWRDHEPEPVGAAAQAHVERDDASIEKPRIARYSAS